MIERRFYFSTRKDRSSAATALLEVLVSQGWKRTYVWSDITLSPDQFGDVATSEIQGIQSADLVVVLLPGGYGTHVEIGAALAFGKPVILHAPDQGTLNTPYPCVFHHHPLIKLIVSEVVNIEEFITIMTSMLENNPS